MKETIDFAKIEEDAVRAFEMSQNLPQSQSTEKKEYTAEESEKYIENIRLAYKDLEDEVAKQISKSDPNKVDQVERLGMGVARIASSQQKKQQNPHSPMTDMFTIEQEPSQSQVTSSYSSSNTSKLDLIDRYDRLGQRNDPFSVSSRSTSSKGQKSLELSMDEFWDTLESEATSRQQQKTMSSFSSSSSSRNQSVIDSVPDYESTRSSKSTSASRAPASGASVLSSSASDEAQKKFGSAKAISSSQFFGDDKTLGYEDKARLNQFAGASSLSSDQFFGREERTAGGSGSGSSSARDLIAGANLYDMKEGVREGVTRVAGRLSNMASDFMSQVQEKYGGY